VGLAILAIFAALLLRAYAWPWFIAATSRAASPDEMDEIAVAVMPYTVPPIFQTESAQQFSVTISGHDPSGRLLPRLSHGKYTALPGSFVHFTKTGLPSIGKFVVSVEPFRVTAFGTATGVVSSTYSNLGCEVWRFSLRKPHDTWAVTSQGLQVIC